MRGRALAASLLATAALPAAMAAQGAPDAPEPGALARRVRPCVRDEPLAAALREVARDADARLAFSPDLLPAGRRVTLCEGAQPLGRALRALLDGTGLEPVAVGREHVVLAPRAPATAEATTTIGGRVTDAETGLALPGALVSLAGSEARATADDEGRWRLRVPAGPGTLVVRRLAYAPLVRQVPRDAGGGGSLDVALRPAARALERVVVTGSILGAEHASLPTALAVLDGEQIRARGARTLGDLLHGDVPGVLTWSLGPAVAGMRYASLRGASSFGGNWLKTYVDGVEVANPLFPNLTDLSSIERIEVVRGPQGAALYGSDAASGVLNVVTRKGAREDAPRGALRVHAGAIGSAYDRQDVTRTDAQGLDVAGAREGVSGALSGWLERSGAYTAGAAASTAAFHAGTRARVGGLGIEASMRGSRQQLGYAYDPTLREDYRGGAGGPGGGASTGGSRPGPGGSNSWLWRGQQVGQFTGGVTLRLATGPWLTQMLVLGGDQAVLDLRPDAAPFASAIDSVLRTSRGTSTRLSARWAAVARLASGGPLEATLTTGADASRLRQAARGDGFESPPPSILTGTAFGTSGTQRNLGLFAQGDLALGRRLFVTGGLRGDRNDNFGDDYGTAWVPMAGVSWVQRAGLVTVKPRLAWGEGIRAPNPAARASIVRDAWVQVANPALGPESQRGIEWGADVGVGPLLAQVTRFRQRARDLVQQVEIDMRAGQVRYQQQNVGEIENRGWEAQASLALAPWTATAAATWTRSVVERVADGYTGALRVGDRMLEVPARTLGGSLGWSHGPLRLTTSVQRVADWVNYDYQSIYRVPAGTPLGSPRDWWIRYPGATRVDAMGAWTFGGRMVLELRADNLLGQQRTERDNLTVAPGRTITGGMEIRF